MSTPVTADPKRMDAATGLVELGDSAHPAEAVRAHMQSPWYVNAFSEAEQLVQYTCDTSEAQQQQLTCSAPSLDLPQPALRPIHCPQPTYPQCAPISTVDVQEVEASLILEGMARVRISSELSTPTDLSTDTETQVAQEVKKLRAEVSNLQTDKVATELRYMQQTEALIAENKQLREERGVLDAILQDERRARDIQFKELASKIVVQETLQEELAALQAGIHDLQMEKEGLLELNALIQAQARAHAQAYAVHAQRVRSDAMANTSLLHKQALWNKAHLEDQLRSESHMTRMMQADRDGLRGEGDTLEAALQNERGALNQLQQKYQELTTVTAAPRLVPGTRAPALHRVIVPSTTVPDVDVACEHVPVKRRLY
ncbi:hypothetical protein JKP88DRAFT_244919 [Tribonema minus]|uniref:Uncharacterized protein n=1 Tax=Tribonema minus TaxID=303371 RepID=A0A835Z0E1_9STRA|nr:hypothetical protein JKP88DRAFT_244919 [Tribonema minus]